MPPKQNDFKLCYLLIQKHFCNFYSRELSNSNIKIIIIYLWYDMLLASKVILFFPIINQCSILILYSDLLITTIILNLATFNQQISQREVAIHHLQQRWNVFFAVGSPIQQLPIQLIFSEQSHILGMQLTAPNINSSMTSRLLALLIFVFLPISTFAQVVWNNYPDIKSGQVAVYTGTNLIVDLTPAVTFTQPFTLSTTLNPVAGAIGISAFQIPETHDFALITNKSITSSAFTFSVQVSDQSAFYVLTMNYIVMFANNGIYRMLTKEHYCTAINQGVGYRSEYDIITPSNVSDTFFNTTDIESTLVLQGFRLINTQGTYTFLGVTVNIPKAGTINATFFTYEENAVYFVQYTVLFYKRTVAYQNMVEIFDVGYANFTFNSTLINLFFNSIETRYTEAAGRMFFGLRQFNFTYLNNKKFQLNANNYNNLWSGYVFSTETLVRIRISYYFFVQRTCNASTYFYKNLSNSAFDNCYASCSTFGDRPVADASTTQCLSCHYSCLTCTSLTSTGCQTCSSAMYRTQSGTSCPCDSGYLDNGVSVCIECSEAMVGCRTCSSSTVCLTCSSGFTGAPNCTCATNSVVSGFCNTVYGCTAISNITTVPLCTACDQDLYLQLAANFTCICINGTTTLPNLTCSINCGDKYVLPQEGCDDGNLVNGDGCSSACKVEKYWSCTGAYAAGSTCKISTVPNLEYVGIQRVTSENTAILYFTLTPYFVQYTYINYTGLLDSTQINNGFEVQFKPSQNMLLATIHYTEDIEGTYQTFILYLNSTKYFWSSSDWATFHLKGVNCELTYDSALWMHNVLKYVYVGMIVVALILFIVSCFFEKWIGLQLIQTYQSIFYLFALLQQCPFQFSGLVEAFRYSNGYDDLMPSEYYQIYTLSNPLIALGSEKQFLSNYNVMYIMMFCVILLMIGIGLIKRKYRIQLEQQISKKINDKVKKLDKVYSVVFGRIFIMIVFFSMYKIIFSFCVQLSSEMAAAQMFPDQLNVITGIIAFIILFSMISFILYWFLLLPANFNEQEEFMSLKFQNMNFYYPVLYLAYQTIFILLISITYLQTFSAYIILSLQIVYLFAIIYLRPYNTLRKFNRLFHNLTIVINQIILIGMTSIIIRWNSIIGSSYQQFSNEELTAYCFLILIFLFIVVVMAALRIAMFNKEVVFKCFKKDEIDVEEVEGEDLGHMKKMITEDKEKLLRNQIPETTVSYYPKETEMVPLKKKAKDQLFEIDDSKIDALLEANEKRAIKEDRTNKKVVNKSRSKVKSSISSKMAELPKTSLETYVEIRKLQKQMQNEREQ